MEDKMIGVLLRQLTNTIKRQIHGSSCKMELDRATGANSWIIGYLSRNSDRDIFQKDIEKEFGITRSTASRVLILMEQKGFIERCGVSGDSRLKKLTLTPKAVAASKEMERFIGAAERRMTAGFSPDELHQLRGYLIRLQKNLATKIDT